MLLILIAFRTLYTIENNPRLHINTLPNDRLEPTTTLNNVNPIIANVRKLVSGMRTMVSTNIGITISDDIDEFGVKPTLNQIDEVILQYDNKRSEMAPIGNSLVLGFYGNQHAINEIRKYVNSINKNKGTSKIILEFWARINYALELNKPNVSLLEKIKSIKDVLQAYSENRETFQNLNALNMMI
ncbi:hypothetical protein NUSPORA_01606 [Nucleospora cyclopteri]